MNTILLTGYRGLIGHALFELLSTDPHIELIVVGSSSDSSYQIPATVEWLSTDIVSKGFLLNRKIDTVVNCANTYGSTLFSGNSPIRVNLEFPLFLLESFQNTDTHFINLDTSLNKSQYYYRAKPYYSLSKKHLNDYLRIFSKEHLVSNIVCEHVYGIGSLKRSTLISDLIQSGLSGNHENLAISPGHQKRDFIYVEDVATAILNVIKERNKLELDNYEDFEVGSGNALSILDLGKIIQQKLNLDSPFPFGSSPYRDAEVMHSVADLTLMTSLGWKPRITLSEGLDRLIDFAMLEKSTLNTDV